MSDIIDIEEHDVMDNPTLRRLFPDLSVIKKEISQYDSDAAVSLRNDKYKTVNTVQCGQSQEVFIFLPSDADLLFNRLQKEGSLFDAYIIDVEEHNAMVIEHNPKPKQLCPDLPMIKEESQCCRDAATILLPTDEDKTRDVVQSKSKQSKMSDEIDIEEHDVLDNPTLKRLFPDLSVIKEEISNFESEINVKLDMISKETEELSLPIDVKHISKSDSSNFTTSDPEDHGSPEKNEGYLHSNIIILGSKPNKSTSLQEEKKQEIKRNINSPKVTLENVLLNLNKSKMYCKDCRTLFPSIYALEDHIKTVHDHQIKHSFSKLKNSLKKYQCNHCGSFLSTKNNLLRHFKNIHDDIKETVYRISKTKKKCTSKVAIGNEKKTNLTDPSCYHCHMSFPSQKSLIEHLYEVLQPGKTECKKPTKLNSNPEKTKCHETLDHIEETTKIFECCKCATKFLTKEKLDLHNDENHKSFNVKPIKIIKAREKSVVTYKVRNIDSTDDEPEVLPKKMRKAVSSNDEATSTQSNEISKHYSVTEKLKCHKCNKEFRSKSTLKQHFASAHTKHVTLNNHNSTNKNIHDKEILVEKAYQCSVCFYYGINYNAFNRHMINNHEMHEIPKPRKVLFDSQCKFCSAKLVNMRSYNIHIVRYHEDKSVLKSSTRVCSDIGKPNLKITISNKNGKPKPFAFKSVLYKCNKCDIHFVTAKNAVNHLDHMEVLINWKCFICNRIFKKIDKFLHVKQHSYSHSFTVYDICESDLNKVLYKCPKCTIHFNEDSYLTHYSICGKRTPDSVYCKICDYLINTVDFDCHNSIHAENKYISPFDFTIVETDSVIDINPISNCVVSEYDAADTNDRPIDLKKIFHDKSRFYMSFCQSCESFVTNLSSTRKVHREARCMHIPKHTCKECGLIFTHQTIKSHRKLHSEVNGLSIQHFFFYDFNSKKLVSPPVPNYPHCDVCTVHFLSKNDVKEHECNGYESVVCHICQIKLSKTAYKFHIQFHEYSLRNGKTRSDNADLMTEINCINSEHTITSKKKIFVDMKFMYSCKSCKVTFHTYDHVIKHCQSHYDQNKITETTQSCQRCSLRFEKEYYKTHEQMHNDYNMQSAKIINFDPLYFRYYNNFWMKHMFVSLSDDQIEQIVGDSIYRYEGRLKMEVFQSGLTYLTLYKCEKCSVFVDPKSLYVHVENLQCTKLIKYPCSVCGLCFDSSNFKVEHESRHGSSAKPIQSYRLVMTNKKQDQIYHNMLFNLRDQIILYQCRNCNVAIDKTQRRAHNCDISDAIKCMQCGLFFHKEHFDTHIKRHQDLDKFNTKHFNLVLFGKTLHLVQQKLDTNFTGRVYDYTFYKCKTCELCIRAKDSTFKHKCVFDDSKCKCVKCDLYFIRQEITSHAILHETNPDLEEYNLNIVQFDATPNLAESKRKTSNSLVQNVDKNNKLTVECSDKLVKIFKCDCELHFVDVDNARKHYKNCNPKMKISKQRCSKCELLFTPDELFSHLLTHHGDKKIEYKFNIAPIPVSIEDRKNAVYKCIKCNLHFVRKSEVNDHFNNCDESSSSVEKCSKCGLRFSLYSYHRNKHRKTCEKKYEVDIVSHQPLKESIDDNSEYIDDFVSEKDMLLAAEYSISKESLQKIDLSKYNNVLYKCEVCNIHFLTGHTRRRHSIHFSTPLDVCSICGLSFSLLSLTKHSYIHHERLKLQKKDFIIKIHA